MFELKNYMPLALVVSVSSYAGTLGDVIETYRQNQYALANGAGAYDRADPADRKLIEQYYSELEASALLSPMTNALETTSLNAQAMISAIRRSIDSTGVISSDVESCMSSRDLSVQQRVLSRGATSARAQLESAYHRSRYVSAPEFDLEGIISAYNEISARDWTKDFLRCCKKESLDRLERSGSQDRRVVQRASLQSANESTSRELESLHENGCNNLGAEIADKQNVFATQDYFLPSRVQDPLEGLKMTPQELGDVLRSSSVRSTLRKIRENSHSPTQAMMAETSYFEEIDAACKKAKDKEMNKSNDFWKVLAKTGANAAICHLIPYMATTNWESNDAQIAYMAADLTLALPWKDLKCDPAITALYRSQRPTDPNVIADKWNIPAMQNPVFINQLRSMVPLQQPFPIVRAPDGSIILPGGMIGGDAPTREQVESQLYGEYFGSNPIIRNSTANRRLGNFDPNFRSSNGSSRLAFLSGPSGSMRYVRSANTNAATGRSLSGAVMGVRSLSGNVQTNNSAAPQSASAIRQMASQSRTLANNMVSAQKGRGLAALSQTRTQSALKTRELVSRSITSKSTRVSAEWIAKVLRDRRSKATSSSPTNPDVVIGGGPRQTRPSEDDRNQQIADEIFKANQRRREAMLAQADAMSNSIRNAVTRSGEIVQQIQTKLLERDRVFNKTVESMVKKPPNSQYKMVNALITEDGARMQELAILKAEYDALSASIPMLTSSLNRLGGFNPQINPLVNSNLGSNLNLPTAGTDGRFNGGSSTSAFSDPKTSVPMPRASGATSEFSKNLGTQNIMESLALKLLPEAWANAAKPGSVDYEKNWAKSFEVFSRDWDLYLKKLRDVEQRDRAALVERHRQLRVSPSKLELQEPDAASFSLMWETMEVVSDETKILLESRTKDSKQNAGREKIFKDIESAQADADKTIDLLAEWGQGYIKSAPKSYYGDPQAWEVLIPNAILY